MLLYGLYAFAYPVRQFLYDDADLRIRCLYDPGNPKCVPPKGSVESAKPPQLDQETEHEFRAHVLQLFYDNSVAARNFTLHSAPSPREITSYKSLSGLSHFFYCCVQGAWSMASATVSSIFFCSSL
jgi:hypothetical protein